MQPLDFFDEVVEHRNNLLAKFKDLNPAFFHVPLLPNCWSCEVIFRHLLAGMKWLADAIPTMGEQKMHHYAIDMAEVPVESISWLAVKESLGQVTAEIRSYLAEIAEEDWLKVVQKIPIELTLEKYFYSLMEHEIEHHGQIRWILKRYTNMDDNEMYGVEL